MFALRRNLGYKLLSLAVAALLYAIASAQNGSRTPSEVFVTPEVLGIPATLVLKTPPAGQLVTVAGPSSLVDAFRLQGIKATVDAHGAQAGSNTLKVQYQIPEAARGKLTVTGPESVTVGFEEPLQKEYVVDVLYDNAPPPGYTFRDPVTYPRRIKVTGLAADVSRVYRVVALLDNADSVGAVERTVGLIAQDRNERAVGSVTIVPSEVRVKLDVQRTPATKTLVLSAELVGSLEPGYRLSSYRFSPTAVTVAGELNALARLSSLDVRLSIEGLRETVTRRVPLTPPPGTKIQGDTSVSVTLDIAPLLTAETAASPSPPPSKGTPP
jgi:YbbR domain-containing protein